MLGLRRSKYKRVPEKNKRNEEISWEVRPGGMVVQKRSDGVGASKSMIVIKVSHGSHQYEIKVPAQSTFGDVKKILVSETGLKPNEQRLLFRGKEKEDEDWLHMVGVMDMSKLVLLEDPASRERKLQERNKNNRMSKAFEAIMKVRVEVDKLTKKVAALESGVHNGAKFSKEVIVLTELFMTELLKLDNIAAEGEAKELRRIEVLRIQSSLETLDILKSRYFDPFSNRSNSVSVMTKWEKFDSGVGSLSAPNTPSSRNIENGWAHFD